MAEHLRMAINEVRNIESLTVQFIKKIFYSKTSIQKEMLGEKMFYEKYFKKFRKINDEILRKHNFKVF